MSANASSFFPPERELVAQLIIGIKREKPEFLQAVQDAKGFLNPEIILTAIYLSVRFQKFKSYKILREEHISEILQRIGKHELQEENYELIYEGLLADHPFSSFYTQNNNSSVVQNIMISTNSEIYKRIMLKALNFGVKIKDSDLLSFILNDSQIIIDSKLLYLLLKHELHSSVMEIIHKNLKLSDGNGYEFSREDDSEYSNIRIKTNIKTGRQCAGNIVEFMIKNEFTEYLTQSFIAETKSSEDVTILPALLKQKKEKWAELLIKENYSSSDQVVLDAIENECFSFLLFYIKVSESELLEFQNEIVQVLIGKIQSDPKHIEIYLYMLLKYQKYISLPSTKRFLNYIEECLHTNDSNILFLYGQPNPIKINILVIEIIEKMVGIYPSYKIKGQQIRAELLQLVQHIQSQIDSEDMIRQIFYDRDILNREIIYIVGNNNLIELLENKNMQAIIDDIWMGPYELESNLISSTSTLASLLCSKITKRDTEFKNRSHMLTRDVKSMKSHPYQFTAWKYGMHARYIFEVFIFLTLFVINFIAFKIILDRMKNIFRVMETGEEPTAAQLRDMECDIDSLAWGMKITFGILYIFSFTLYHYIFQILFLFLAKRQVTWDKFIQAEFIIDFVLYSVSEFTIQYYNEKYYDLIDCTVDENSNTNDTLTKALCVNTFFEDAHGFDIVTAIILLFNVLRIFFTLRVSHIFGPLIKMIKLMIESSLTFLFFYFMNLWTFAVIAEIMLFSFYEKSKFISTTESFFTLFEASLGNFDFEYLNETQSHDNYWVRRIFMVFFLLLNMILLMNFLIAILSNVYSIYVSKSSSLYMVEIVKLKNIFANDETYGCLISAPNPISLIFSVPATITFLVTSGCSNRKSIHKRINRVFIKLEYFLVFLLELAFYIVLNGMLIPIVYIKWVVLKFILIFRAGERSKGQKSRETLIFLLLGLIILLFNYFSDIYYFFVHSYYNNPEHRSSTKKTDYIRKNLYVKLLEFFELNKDGHNVINYNNLLNKLKDLCELKVINFLGDINKRAEYQGVSQSHIKRKWSVLQTKDNQNNRKKHNILEKSNTENFLVSLGLKKKSVSNKNNKREQVHPIIFEGQKDMEDSKEEEILERIMNFASISSVIGNIKIKNKDGVQIVSLDLLYTLMFVHLHMQELRSRCNMLSKFCKQELIHKATLKTLRTKSTVSSNSSFMPKDVGKPTKFIADHVLMTLLHAYQIHQLNKGIIFFKTHTEQPLKIDYIIRKLDIITLNLDRLSKKFDLQGSWEHNEGQQIKLEKKRTFEGEIEATTIYKIDVKWKEITSDQSHILSNKQKNNKDSFFSNSSFDEIQDNKDKLLVGANLRFLKANENPVQVSTGQNTVTSNIYIYIYI